MKINIIISVLTEKTGDYDDYLLYILGPFRGITEGHESTVGQDGEHDQHAEHRGDKVKEAFISILVYALYDALKPKLTVKTNISPVSIKSHKHSFLLLSSKPGV